MGFRLSFVAIRGIDKAHVLAALKLSDCGDVADSKSESLSCADLPDGWFLIVSDRFDFPTPKRMAAVSAGGMAVSCAVEEHVMYSVARGYRDGEAVWSIDHDGGQKGLYHLEIEGELPPEWAAIHTRLNQEQGKAGGVDAAVDYMFDAPAELAQTLCGYRYYEDGAKSRGLVFTRLFEEPPVKGTLSRLLGWW